MREEISTAMKEALKAKDQVALGTMRLISAALKDRDIAARSNGNAEGISDDDILGLLQTMIKQRRESIEMYTKGGRQDLADREANEIVVIELFLPDQMDEDAIKEAVTTIIQETGASGLKEMGTVMATLRERHPGAMDFGKAGVMAKAALS